MMKLKEALKQKKVLLSDGAWGTMLFEKGLKTGDCPDSWNLTNEDIIFSIAKMYSEAGADIITTNSFGASGFKLLHYSLAEKTRELNIKAASIARKAAGPEKFVFGSVGPTGKLLLMGDISEQEMFDDYKIRVSALEEGRADLILIETMTDIEEAKIALKAAKKHTKLPVACTFTFDKIKTGEFRTIMGISPEKMLYELIESGADIIGSNCGNGFEGMIEIAEELRTLNAEIPILIQANAGIPNLINNKNVFPETPERMTTKLKDLIDKGVNIVGGCCGTTPEFISSFAEVINKYYR